MERSYLTLGHSSGELLALADSKLTFLARKSTNNPSSYISHNTPFITGECLALHVKTC